MKGTHLSMNVIVLLIITIIVIAVLIAFFMGIFPSTGEEMKCQSEFRVECERFRAAGGCDRDEGFFNEYERRTELEDAAECFLKTRSFDTINNTCCA